MNGQKRQAKAPLRRLLRGIAWFSGLTLIGCGIVMAGAAPQGTADAGATRLLAKARPSLTPALSDWIGEMDDLIDDITGSGGEAQGLIEAAVNNELDPVSKTIVDGDLNQILAKIEQLFDGNRSPSLTPVDAGEINQAVQPTTALDYADAVVLLASEARNELEAAGVDADDEYLGTRLKTIRHLITRSVPHNYRVLAGLE